MSWGHITSKDLVTWTDHKLLPALAPDQTYDKEGVFTGCFVPQGPNGEANQLSLVYSSICKLPFHWTKPYPENAAGISLACSTDRGVTWKKDYRNPILDGEPTDGSVTGCRDPYIASWPAADALFGTENGLYGILSGGYAERGPTAWFYQIARDDLTSWRYVGPLVDTPKPKLDDPMGRIGKIDRWTGHPGHNWECAMFVPLQTEDGVLQKQFVIAGIEGMPERQHLLNYPRPKAVQNRSTGFCIWMSGELSLNSEKQVKMSNDFGGVFDHGCFYAANSFEDPVSKRRILIGWIREEDISLDKCRSKGWTGCLGIPRELYVQVIQNCSSRALKSNIQDIGSVQSMEANGVTDIITLGLRPLPGLAEKLPHGQIFDVGSLTLPNEDQASSQESQLKLSPTPDMRSYKLSTEIHLLHPEAIKLVGFHIKANASFSNRTTIAFSPNFEELILDRTKSNTDPTIAKHTEIGAHTLFTNSTHLDGEGVLEKLILDIWVDGDVVEVFANERTAISSMVYSDAEHCGIVPFVEVVKEEELKEVVVFEKVRIVTGLGVRKEM